VRQFAHAQIVDDQQRHGGEVREDRLAGTVERGVRQFFQQRVRFTIRDTVALLDRSASDRLGEMAFPGARRAEEEGVLALADKAGRRELVQQRPVHLLVKVEIKAVERAIGIAEARLFVAPIKGTFGRRAVIGMQDAQLSLLDTPIMAGFDASDPSDRAAAGPQLPRAPKSRVLRPKEELWRASAE